MEDITATQRVERELALFKVCAPPGAARTEVVQLADMFRARIVDVSGELKSGNETLILYPTCAEAHTPFRKYDAHQAPGCRAHLCLWINRNSGLKLLQSYTACLSRPRRRGHGDAGGDGQHGQDGVLSSRFSLLVYINITHPVAPKNTVRGTRAGWWRFRTFPVFFC